jgi:hypothetical protein
MMQQAEFLDNTYFFRNEKKDVVVITVEPDLARMVMGSRLIPAKLKRDFLSSQDTTASSIIVDHALESELFCDVMIQLGIIVVQKATKGDSLEDE